MTPLHLELLKQTAIYWLKSDKLERAREIFQQAAETKKQVQEIIISGKKNGVHHRKEKDYQFLPE